MILVFYIELLDYLNITARTSNCVQGPKQCTVQGAEVFTTYLSPGHRRGRDGEVGGCGPVIAYHLQL